MRRAAATAMEQLSIHNDAEADVQASSAVALFAEAAGVSEDELAFIDRVEVGDGPKRP